MRQAPVASRLPGKQSMRRSVKANSAAHSVALLATLLVLGAANDAAAEEAAAKAESRFDFSDTDKCLLCHSDLKKMKDHADFVGVAPAEIWGSLDKHSQSFLLLKDKSRHLTNQILGFDLREAFTSDELTTL